MPEERTPAAITGVRSFRPMTLAWQVLIWSRKRAAALAFIGSLARAAWGEATLRANCCRIRLMNRDSCRVTVGKDVFIASTAYVGGDVALGDQCAILHHVTVRGDVSAIRIGRRVNVQDGAIIHTRSGVPLDIEDDVSIGHRAVVHCRRVGAGTLIGIGAIVLDDAEIGRNCLVAAGAVVTPGTIVPDGKVLMGVPARIVRDTTAAEGEYAKRVVWSYLELGRRHAAGEFSNAAGG